MTTAATISARLILDSKSYDDGLSNAGKKATDFQAKMSNMGSTMMGVGTKMTLGLTAPILATGGAMVNAAADLQESGGAVETIFGDMSGAIQDFSDVSAEMVGLSSADFNQLASVGGALLKNLGFDAGDAADEMVKLTERASDLGAVFNAETSTALEAVQSALKGEFNPLEQFGVKMNAADITARALAMGLADANGELDNAAKAQAALAIFYEQTAAVQGTFAKEADGVTGSMKILKAQITDQAAALGTQLLPIALKVLSFFSDLLTKFDALSPSAKTTIMVILGIVAAIGPLVTIIGGLISAFSAIIPVVTAIAGVLTFPLIAIIAAIGAAIALLVVAWKNNWGGIQETVQKAVQFIQLIIAAFKSAMVGDWEKFGQLLRVAWEFLWQHMSETLSTWGEKIKTGVINIIEGIKNFFANTDWKQIGKDIVNGIVNGISSLASWAWGQMAKFAANMADAFTGFFGIDSDSKLMIEYAGNMIGGLTTGLEPMDTAINHTLDGIDTSAPQSQGAGFDANSITQAIQVGLSNIVVDAKFNLEGSKGELARVLKPSLDKESTRVGKSLISGGVA